MAISVDTSAWVAGMTVNAVNTGFDTISSSGTLSCVTAPLSDLPPSSAGTTLIETQANKTLVLKIEANPIGTGVIGAGTKAYQRVFIRAVRTDAGLSLVNGAGGVVNNTTFSGNVCLEYLLVKKDTDQPGRGGGIIWLFYDNTGLAGRNLTECGACVNADGTYTDQQSVPSFPLDQWCEHFCSITAGASGHKQIGFGRQPTGRVVRDTGSTAATLNGAFQLSLPALAGIKWQVHRAATGNVVFPDFLLPDQSPAHHSQVFRWPTTFSSDSGSIRDGDRFSVVNAGALPWASRPVSIAKLGGPARERIVARIPSGASTFRIESVAKVGVLQFSPDGWCTLIFEDILIMPGTSGTIRLNDAAGALLMYVTWNGSMSFFEAAETTPLFTLPNVTGKPILCSFGIVFENRAGTNAARRFAWVLDKTSGIADDPTNRPEILHTAALNNWTLPASIGITRLEFTFGGLAAEFGGVSMHRIAWFSGPDSWGSNVTSILNWQYVTWASSSTNVAADDTILDSNGNGITATAFSNGVLKYAAGYCSEKLAAGAGQIKRGASVVGTTATQTTNGNLLWFGTGTVTGTFQKDEVITGGTSAATARIVLLGTLDGALGVPEKMIGLIPLTGTFTYGETVTGGTSGATCLSEIPQYGCLRSSPSHGTSATVYSHGRDASSPGCVVNYDPKNPDEWAITFVGSLGRGGHKMIEASQAVNSYPPGIGIYDFNGLTNSLRVSTKAEADVAVADYVDGVMQRATSVANRWGYYIIDMPVKGTGGNYDFAYASYAIALATDLLTSEIRGANYRRRIKIVKNRGYPGSDVGNPNHLNAAGAGISAARSMTGREAIAGTGGGLRNRTQ